MGRRILRAGLLVGVLALLSALWTPAASAHAFLVSSSPGNGTTVTAPPSQLRLSFSESVVLGATSITVTDSAGHAHRATDLRLVAGEGTEEPSFVTGALPPLHRGAYQVSWRTISSDDFHQTSGVIVFGIGTRVHASPFVEPLPRPEEALLRWLVFGGLATALGCSLLMRPGRRSPGLDIARGRRLATAGAGVAAGAAVGLLLDQPAGDGSSFGALLLGRYGARWSVREVGLLLLLAGTLRAGGRVRSGLLVVGTAGAVLGSALLGHSGAGPRLATTRVLADAAHLTAAAVWTGLLLAAAVVVVHRGRSVTVREVLGGFRYPAAVSVAVLVVTGLYLTSSVVGSIDALLLTFYGRVLMVKVALFAVAGLLGLTSWLRLHRRPRSGTPRRAVVAEATALVLAIAGAAVLTSAQPAREPRFVRSDAPPVVGQTSAAVADLQEEMSVRPNVPGRNVILVDVYDTRRPAPAPITSVTVSVDGGSPAVAHRVGESSWSVPVTIGSPGARRIEVAVSRESAVPTAHEYRWTVRGGPATRPATVSNAPIGTALQVTAGLLGGAVVVTALALVLLGRRRRPAPRAVPVPDESPDDVLVDA